MADVIVKGKQSVVTDDEAQFSGDVETPYVEIVEQDAAPALPTDKSSALLYALVADHQPRIKQSNGTILNLAKGCGYFPMAEQASLSDATIATFIAAEDGEIIAAQARLGSAVTGDRTAEVNVLINGVSIYTVKPLLNAAATTLAVAGTLNATKVAFEAGDIITVVDDYTAGTGGGGANLLVSIGFQRT
jgi:hypothetical protein